MRYMVGMKQAAKDAAKVGLAGLVIALGASGCFESASSRGLTLTLAKVEYGAKTTRSKEPEIQKQVIESDAKYEDNVNTAPGNAFGIVYK